MAAARRNRRAHLRAKAESGDLEACCQLAWHLYSHPPIRKREARRGDAHGWYNLGQMYRQGQGVRQSWPKALAFYRRAADQGLGGAFHWLVAYHEGTHGTPGNSRLASAWLRKAEAAARRGSGSACQFLGDRHRGQDGDGPDPRRRALWYRRGVALGDSGCMLSLGVLHHDGAGVKKDYRRAVALYRRAAEHGEARAAYNLGLCYRDGEGVRRESRAARSWFEPALRLGEEDARSALERLKRARKRASSMVR